MRSTATLACIAGGRLFRGEFLAALELLERGDVTAEQLKGSWAGAFGPTQFMRRFIALRHRFRRRPPRDVIGSCRTSSRPPPIISSARLAGGQTGL